MLALVVQVHDFHILAGCDTAQKLLIDIRRMNQNRRSARHITNLVNFGVIRVDPNGPNDIVDATRNAKMLPNAGTF